MIEQLLANRDSIPYALAIVAILGATTVGYMLGKQDESTVCAEYIVELERLEKKVQDLNEQLTKCSAKGAGAAALDCGPICDARVEKALSTYKEVVCSD